MKKIFTLIAAAAVTLSASAETVIYSWESPEGTAIETGGKATHENAADGAANRVNYKNAGYHTICLNGKLANIEDEAGAKNADYIKISLDNALNANDVISITGYLNKDEEKTANAAIRFVSDKGSTLADITEEENYPNIGLDASLTPGTHTIAVPDAAAGCKVIYLTRNAAGTNVFCTKVAITRAGEAGGDEGETPSTPAEGVAFAIEGNGATTYGKSFDAISTPFEFDFESKTVTLKNFIGSNANIVLKYTLAKETADPMMTGTQFNSAAVSGLGAEKDNSGYKYCDINDFSGNIIVKKDGVNFGKLENLRFYVGYASNITVATDPANGDVIYSFTIMIGGDYYPWDAEKSDWGEKSAYPENILMKTDVNVSKATSGIENIEFIEIDNSNAPVEYYNLQGVRINEPAAGQIVIRRQGTNVSKIIVR